jgi:hypothetical protein
MTSPRASLARLTTLAECMAVRLVSLDLRFPEDIDVAALQRKLDEMTKIVNTLAGRP